VAGPVQKVSVIPAIREAVSAAIDKQKTDIQENYVCI